VPLIQTLSQQPTRALYYSLVIITIKIKIDKKIVIIIIINIFV